MNDGGSAFPGMQQAYALPTELLEKYPEVEKAFVKTSFWSNGMSLRDYFAAEAMSRLTIQVSKSVEVNYQFVAEQAYKFADAMLAEREKVRKP